MAEANRPKGFKVLSLGYAEGPDIDQGVLSSDPSTLENMTGGKRGARERARREGGKRREGEDMKRETPDLPSSLLCSDGGLEMLLDDIRVCESTVGMRHYLTNAELTLANAFVLEVRERERERESREEERERERKREEERQRDRGIGVERRGLEKKRKERGDVGCDDVTMTNSPDLCIS
jgi:hypothetical protein